MASKNTPKVPNKIPETRIVGPSRFRSPTEVIQSDSLFVRGNPYVPAEDLTLDDDGTVIAPPPKVISGSQEEKPDVPDLSDIESVTKTKYFDPVTKVEKVKIVIKVRNSSRNKKDVSGVDARIPPKEA